MMRLVVNTSLLHPSRISAGREGLGRQTAEPGTLSAWVIMFCSFPPTGTALWIYAGRLHRFLILAHREETEVL